MTPIYHPNLSEGEINLINHIEWSAKIYVSNILMDIIYLMIEPDLEKATNKEVANHFRNNPEDALEKARSNQQQ